MEKRVYTYARHDTSSVAISRELRDWLNLLAVQATVAGDGPKIAVRQILNMLVREAREAWGEEAPAIVWRRVNGSTVPDDEQSPLEGDA